MTGREDTRMNNLFYVCSLIEYLGRKTKNRRNTIVNTIGRKGIKHLFDYADVYHCENIDKVADTLIEKYRITEGQFDNLAGARYSIPSHWDIGKVYHRLIAAVSEESNADWTDTLIAVYNSWICGKIDDYNSSMYYESPNYLLASYQAHRPLA